MNINKLIEKGEDALKKKNFDYAMEILLQAVSFAPDNRKARELLRKSAFKKHEHSYPSGFAVSVFGIPAKLGMFVAGLGKKSNPEGYMMACEKFLRLDPKNKKVNMALGDAAAAGNHVNAAIFAYETAAEHHPNDQTALKKLARLLTRNQEYRKAHDAYDRVVQLNPKDQEAVKARKNLAAEISLKETGFETARSSQDLIKDKDAAGKLEQAGRMYQTDADLGSQKEQLEERLAAEPANVDLLQDLAEVCKKLKDWPGALAAMDKAIAAKPDDNSIVFARDDLEIDELEERILSLIQKGKKDEAASVESKLVDVQVVSIRKRIEAYPTDMNLRFKLGNFLLKRNENTEAIQQFQQTVKDPKYRSESQLRLGRAFKAQGKYDLALRQLNQALEGQTGMSERVKEIRYELGDIYALKGDAGAAKEQFGMIYESDIGFKDVGDRLAQLDSPEGAGKISLDD